MNAGDSRRRNGISGKLRTALAAMLIAVVPLCARADGGTFDRIRTDGILRCGVTQTGQGLAARDAQGNWKGFFPDFCRVVAASVTGDAESVEFFQVDEVTRFQALQQDSIDILMANTTWTASRDSRMKLAFPVIYYFDGTGFMAHGDSNAKQLSDLEEARVCVGQNTTTIENLKDLITDGKPGLRVAPHHSLEAQINAFYQKKCDLIAYDRLGLITHRARYTGPGIRPVVFPDVISKEPLSPAIRDDDMRWFDAVRWSVYATIAAEELSLTSQNIDHRRSSKSTDIRRFTGMQDTIGEDLGLHREWAFRIVSQVGNYGEIFQRNLGSTVGEPGDRGLNNLWTEGGLLYAPPIR